ncbi:FAD-binding oxidoreductase [Shimia litoralis]|uniref:FAD-binding oxidoreductase n=1 Tax=Shimia litoralis TaxID=420403 RepID=A0A4U7N883_9RHOB|nr:FAD-dependent oxidoreductase [Shimia litoralis]TKZ22165.1 FAD-binding oxidoreductase [Shimia litoralis]
MEQGNTDTTIIGGGVVGLSVAFGLLKAGQSVTVLDGENADLRASQGNFGLTWLQGKGAHFAPYARWTKHAINLWPAFAQELQDMTGIDLAFQATGGYEFFTDNAEFDAFTADLAAQAKTLGDDFRYQTLTGDALRAALPGIGEQIVGATFCPHDGHVNPLRVLQALRVAVQRLGGVIIPNWKVHSISPHASGFKVHHATHAPRLTPHLILCAGLGSADLAPMLGFRTAIRPQKGELMITERIQDRLPFVSSTVRQVDEGGIQIGGTKADVGPDDRETTSKMKSLAQHAIAVWPTLKDVNVVRSWGALRVMTPDGYPVYARAPEMPAAQMITCHSGITLAPAHASTLVDWILNTQNAPDLKAFDDDRF